MSSTAAAAAEPESAQPETQAKPEGSGKKPSLIDEFREVRYEVDIQVGQAVRSLEKILQIKAGDIITLDRPAHESVILTIEDIPIALAEVVTSEKGSSIQITEVGSGE